MKTEVKQTASYAIQGYDYDTETQVLSIHMVWNPPKAKEETLRYGPVPRDTFQKFDRAESKGSFFNKFIRNNYQFLGSS